MIIIILGACLLKSSKEGFFMGRIKTKQFQILTDIEMAWKFMVDVYDAISDKGTENVEAPFFEYALTSTWMNKDYLHLCRFWLDEVIGFVFYENPVTNLHFVLRPGYEELADEMIEYAIEVFPNIDNEKEFDTLELNLVRMTIPDKPNSRNQRYIRC